MLARHVALVLLLSLLAACGTTMTSYQGAGYALEFVEHRSALSTVVVPIFRAADGQPVPVVGTAGVSITGAALGVAGAASSIGAGAITGSLIKQGLTSSGLGNTTVTLPAGVAP